MNNFDEYIRLGEPGKAEKAAIWQTAIGLQDTDGLKVSDYLISLAEKHINGEMTIKEVQERIEEHYRVKEKKINDNRNEESKNHKVQIKNDTVKSPNDTVNTPNVTTNDTNVTVNDMRGTINGTINNTNGTIFDLIKSNNNITTMEISKLLGIGLRTAKRKIKELKNNGFIERVGSNKTGSWKVLQKT